MNYIIFGAGQTGRNAMSFLGYWRVAFFAANEPADPIDDKRVIAYWEMVEYEKTGDYIIVVASARYNAEMVAQLKMDGVVRYFVFHDAAPFEILQFYPSYRLYRQNVIVPYVKAISMLRIDKYKRIAILGNNFFLPYLIAEILFQNDKVDIMGIIKTVPESRLVSFGIPEVTLIDIWTDIDCLLINEKRNRINNLETIELENKRFDVIDIYNLEPCVEDFYHPELAVYKNIYQGKRCFVIGNGPSLRIEDLDKLHKYQEVCFGCNSVYRVYDRTNWRADYLCLSDYRVIEGCKKDIEKNKGVIFCSDVYHRFLDGKLKNVQYYHSVDEIAYPNYPRFSNDITKCSYIGFSVVYDVGITFAVYMGFSEIYLLGMDHSFSNNEVDKKNHFIDDYYKEGDDDLFKKYKLEPSLVLERSTKTFEWVEKYSRISGFRVFNATRGGKLNSFERVDFDTLFK